MPNLVLPRFFQFLFQLRPFRAHLLEPVGLQFRHVYHVFRLLIRGEEHGILDGSPRPVSAELATAELSFKAFSVPFLEVFKLLVGQLLSGADQYLVFSGGRLLAGNLPRDRTERLGQIGAGVQLFRFRFVRGLDSCARLG